ncbi:MAG: hypothetical protein AMXMBFR82_35680 [Candidatus Hydrogenedentota bacterium]
MSTKVNVVIERDDHGYFAYCPDLPGCHTQGDTFEEALANAREAAQLYLETLDVEERSAYLSKEVITVAVEV